MVSRAQPSDRIKTPEEIAQEEREQLEHLEVLHLVMTIECACIHASLNLFYCCLYVQSAGVNIYQN